MPELEETLNHYSALIGRYHSTLDLLSSTGLQALPQHIADALRYARLIEEKAGKQPVVVDVGSGAGLPGVVIAAALPGAVVHLVERRRRRTAFLELASANLQLENCRVYGGDVRDLTGECADAVTGQAVGDIATLVRLTRHLHKDPCWIVSRRGEDQHEAHDEAWRAAGLSAEAAAPSTHSMPAGAEWLEEPLEVRGSLVAVRLPGGSACLPSA